MASENTVNSKDNPTKIRIRSFDMFKGFVIIVIVAVHLMTLVPYVPGESGVDFDPPRFVQAIYLGLMIFFIISGYFYRPQRSFKENITKRVLQLVVAIIVCGITLPLLLWGYMILCGQSVCLDDYIICLQAIFDYPFFQPCDYLYREQVPTIAVQLYGDTGYYFLKMMAVAFVIFYAIADYVLKDMKKAVATVFILLTTTALWLQFVGVNLPWRAHMAPLAAAFMIVGSILAKYKVAEYIETQWKTKRFWCYIAGIIIALTVLLFLFPPRNNFNISRLGAYGGLSVYPFFVEGVLVCILFMSLFYFMSYVQPLYKLLGIVGKHTLAILLLHTFVIRLIIAPFEKLPKYAWFPAHSLIIDILIEFITITSITLMAEYLPKILKNNRMKSRPTV